MVKLILRLLLVVFLLESTWAVAAQYCRHELGLAAVHFGHHTHEHQGKDQSANKHAVSKADPADDASIDNDCAFCHLGAMKSMVSAVVFPSASADAAPPTDLLLSYPLTLPREPERPNWRAAA
jgi:hypothetical protein